MVVRQWNQAQTSAAKGISARAYLNLNVHLAVLCRNTIVPNNPPSQPPRAPSMAKVDSGTRLPDREARHLSKPNAKNVTTLNEANQTKAMLSPVLTRQF